MSVKRQRRMRNKLDVDGKRTVEDEVEFEEKKEKEKAEVKEEE